MLSSRHSSGSGFSLACSIYCHVGHHQGFFLPLFVHHASWGMREGLHNAYKWGAWFSFGKWVTKLLKPPRESIASALGTRFPGGGGHRRFHLWLARAARCSELLQTRTWSLLMLVNVSNLLTLFLISAWKYSKCNRKSTNTTRNGLQGIDHRLLVARGHAS